MITVKIYRNSQGSIYGFDVDDHGESIVCSAVSILTLNTINSIERFTDEEFTCDYDEDGGFLSFVLPQIKLGESNRDVDLLLNSMLFGLEGTQMEYRKQLKVIDKEVQ